MVNVTGLIIVGVILALAGLFAMSIKLRRYSKSSGRARKVRKKAQKTLKRLWHDGLKLTAKEEKVKDCFADKEKLIRDLKRLLDAENIPKDQAKQTIEHIRQKSDDEKQLLEDATSLEKKDFKFLVYLRSNPGVDNDTEPVKKFAEELEHEFNLNKHQWTIAENIPTHLRLHFRKKSTAVPKVQDLAIYILLIENDIFNINNLLSSYKTSVLMPMESILSDQRINTDAKKNNAKLRELIRDLNNHLEREQELLRMLFKNTAYQRQTINDLNKDPSMRGGLLGGPYLQVHNHAVEIFTEKSDTAHTITTSDEIDLNQLPDSFMISNKVKKGTPGIKINEKLTIEVAASGRTYYIKLTEYNDQLGTEVEVRRNNIPHNITKSFKLEDKDEIFFHTNIDYKFVFRDD